jgi:hypothetical protein
MSFFPNSTLTERFKHVRIFCAGISFSIERISDYEYVQCKVKTSLASGQLLLANFSKAKEVTFNVITFYNFSERRGVLMDVRGAAREGCCVLLTHFLPSKLCTTYSYAHANFEKN